MVKKRYTSEEISGLFDKSNKKVEILMEALDFMQSYNGRTKRTCIAMAMGFEPQSDDEGKSYYTKN